MIKYRDKVKKVKVTKDKEHKGTLKKIKITRITLTPFFE